MSKFTVAGVSTNKGRTKVRFCSDLVLRIKNLQKQGDTDIQLIELPQPMTKVEACQYLLDSGQFKQYANDIAEIQGKKTQKNTPSKTVIKKQTVEVDPEIEDIKELVAA